MSRVGHPGFPGHSESPPGVRPLPAARPSRGGGTGCAGERPPRPAAAAAAAGELCRRLAPVRSSCSSFPGNFRPGVPPGRRAAPPAQPGPGASAGRPGLRARGARLETPTAHSPPELGPLDRASWCDTDGGPRGPAPEDAGRSECPHGGSVRRPSAREGRAGARARFVFPWGRGRPQGARPVLVTMGFRDRAFKATLGDWMRKRLGPLGRSSGRDA